MVKRDWELAALCDLQLVHRDSTLERLGQNMQILSGTLGLACTRERLRCRLLDARHRLPDLHHAACLLLRRRRDLYAGLRAALDLGRDPVDHLSSLPGQL